MQPPINTHTHTHTVIHIHSVYVHCECDLVTLLVGLDGESKDLSVKDAVRVAIHTTTWMQHHHGNHLQKLQLDALTLTEVVRLHLLASRCPHFFVGNFSS